MQKMTIMALPENIIDSLRGRQGRQIGAAAKMWKKIRLGSGEWFIYGLSFLLGRLVFLGDLAPFGLGFFAAVAQTDKTRLLGTGLGILLGALSMERYEEAAVCLAAMLVYVRLRLRFTKMDRKLLAVPFTMFFSVLACGLFLDYAQGDALYGYLTTCFNAVLCLISAQLFLYGAPILLHWEKAAQAYRQSESERFICIIVILALGVAGIGEVSLFGLRLREIGCDLLVMVLALAGGAGAGSAVGVAMGVIVGLSGVGQVLPSVAVYAVSGMVAGVFRPLGKFAVILGFIFGSLILHISFTELPRLLQSIAEVAAAAGVMIFLPAPDIGRMARKIAEIGENGGRKWVEESGEKLRRTAELLYEISASSEARTPTDGQQEQIDLARIFGAVGRKVCEHCPERPDCWEKNYYHTYQQLLSVFQEMGDRPLQGRDLPLVFREKCIHGGRLVEVVNELMEKNRMAMYWRQKLEGQKEMLCDQVKAVGNIISRLAEELDKPLGGEHILEKRLLKKTAEIGCEVACIRVIGKDRPRRVEFEKRACGKKEECVASLLPLVSGILKERLTLTRTCGSEERAISCKICLRAAPRFKARIAKAFIAKDGTDSCGDSVKITPLEDGKISLLLSDGMGSGSGAAKESQLTVNCLSRLLQVSFDVESAVKIVNSLLLVQETGEKFATVDMTIVDQYTGTAEFLKVASAPSYVKRVHEVREIHASALPVGILNHIELKPVRAQLALHDFLIMVSDGIDDIKDLKLRSGDKEGWLLNFIRRTQIDNEEKLAAAILEEALRLSGGKAGDDMSVIVMRLEAESLV